MPKTLVWKGNQLAKIGSQRRSEKRYDFSVRLGGAIKWMCRSPAALRAPKSGRVEKWRGGLGGAYRLPALSVAGASLASPCSVSTSRSSNRACGFLAHGSPTGFTDQHTMALSRIGRDSENIAIFAGK